MFNNQKIEPAQWPWAYLQSIQDQDTTKWIDLRDQVPGYSMQNGIGSESDVRSTFRDMYIDLAEDAQRGRALSIRCDQPYLS